MRLFDTHAHLCSEKFNEDRFGLIESLPGSGLIFVVDVSCSPGDFSITQECCGRYPFIRAAYGVHPHEAGDMTDADLETVAQWITRPECVALGEIGLDYHYDFAPRELQRLRFEQQLELAAVAKKPVIIHDREAHADTLAILRRFRGRLTGVMHCYSGSAEMVPNYIDLGFYISFSGSVTFASGNKTQLAAVAVPDERILIETDCPYLTPVPFRGRRNDPSYVRHTCIKIAELRGADCDEFAELTLQNGKRLFSL